MKRILLFAVSLVIATAAYALEKHNGQHVFTGNLTIPSGATLTVDGTFTNAGSGGMTLANGESINTDTDDTFDFTRDDAGTVTITASDNNAVAALTVLPGGAAALTLGGASTTSVTLTTDGTGTGEVVLPAQSIAAAEMVDDTVDGAQLADTVTLDATLLGVSNGSTGGVIVNFHDYADTADDDMPHAVLTTNCTDATTGAEDCDFSIGVVEAGAAAETRFSIDADAGVTVGSANTTALTVTTDGTGTAEVSLPAGSVDGTELLDGTINAVDEAFAGRAQIVICGDLTTINNNTIYYGPNRAVTATAIGGFTCDVSSAGNATEATADALAFEAQAFQVRAMVCRTVDTNATVSFTLRTAEGATVPSVTCSTADNQLDCVADVQTTTAIASGATIAVAAASSADLGTAAFVCAIDVVF